MPTVKLFKNNSISLYRILIEHIQSKLVQYFHVTRYISLICEHCTDCLFCTKKIALIVSFISTSHRVCSNINRFIMSVCCRNINSDHCLLGFRWFGPSLQYQLASGRHLCIVRHTAPQIQNESNSGHGHRRSGKCDYTGVAILTLPYFKKHWQTDYCPFASVLYLFSHIHVHGSE